MSNQIEDKEIEIPHKSLREHLEVGAGKIIDLAAKTQDKLSGKSHLYKWLYQYVLINIVWAKPSLSLICSTERVEQLKQLGLTETGIFSLVLTQFAVDHVAPNIIIGGIHTFANNAMDMPEKYILPASFIAGRIAWGVMAGLVHSSAFALTKRDNNPDSGDNLMPRNMRQLPISEQLEQEIDLKFGHNSF